MLTAKIIIFYLVIIILVVVLGNIYKNMNKKTETLNVDEDLLMIQKYLINDKSLASNRKPYIWIHIDYEINARNWDSWGSRNTRCLNQPYLYLTIRSIINKCGNSFNIILIDDYSFNKVLPDWSVKVYNMPNPLKQHLRDLAMAKVLHNYGGFLIPASYICLSDMKSFYDNFINKTGCFIGEFVNRNSSAGLIEFFPNTRLMACVKNSPIMREYISYLEPLISKDYTNEIQFLGQNDRWFEGQIQKNKVILTCGQLIGTKDANNKPVLIEELLGDEDIDFSKNLYGIYVPENDILTRLPYQYFARLSPRQVLQSNTLIGKYLLASN